MLFVANVVQLQSVCNLILSTPQRTPDKWINSQKPVSSLCLHAAGERQPRELQGKAWQPPQQRGWDFLDWLPWFLSLLDLEKQQHKLRCKTEQLVSRFAPSDYDRPFAYNVTLELNNGDPRAQQWARVVRVFKATAGRCG